MLSLDEVYKGLGYEKGALLNAVEHPKSGTSEEEEWLEKGDWLALAHKVGAEKIFFVKNDPILVFCALHPITLMTTTLSLKNFVAFGAWLSPLYLFIALIGELRVYRLDRPPVRDANALQKNQQVEPNSACI